MRAAKFYVCLVLFIIFMTACVNSQVVNIVGKKWIRNVSDSDLAISGDECLIFNEDSTYSLSNEMMMNYEDSVFLCRFGFLTGINGKWADVDHNLELVFDTSTFTFDTIPGKVSIEVKTGKCAVDVVPSMRADLAARLEDYYKAVYGSHGSASPLKLNSYVFTDSTLRAKIDGGKWAVWKH